MDTKTGMHTHATRATRTSTSAAVSVLGRPLKGSSHARVPDAVTGFNTTASHTGGVKSATNAVGVSVKSPAELVTRTTAVTSAPSDSCGATGTDTKVDPDGAAVKPFTSFPFTLTANWMLKTPDSESVGLHSVPQT
jgi:hypothetical protein